MKKQRQTSNKRQYTSNADGLTLGLARQRRLRRVGNSAEQKPQPVITPRPSRRREDQPATRLRRGKHSSRSSASSGGLPPVMARGGMESMAARKPRGRKPKRRFDIPLRNLLVDAPGAEVRFPALPHFQFSARVISGTLVVILLACLVFIWQSPIFRITEFRSAGLQRLTVTDLSSALGVLGDSIFAVDSSELEQSLQALFPELKQVEIHIGLPGKLEINAVERQPVLAWTQGDSEVWIDAEGVSFLPRGNLETALVRVKAQSVPPGSLPIQEDVTTPLPGVVQTTVPQLRLAPELVSMVQALSRVAPQDTVLLYNPVHGIGWNDKQYGWKVFFGNETRDIDQKILVYQALTAQLSADGIQPVLVSVEFLHAPFYRMEQ